MTFILRSPIKSPIIIWGKTSKRQCKIWCPEIISMLIVGTKCKCFHFLSFFSIFLGKYFWNTSTLPFYQLRNSSLFHTRNTLLMCHTTIWSDLVLEPKEFSVRWNSFLRAQKLVWSVSCHTQKWIFIWFIMNNTHFCTKTLVTLHVQVLPVQEVRSFI